MAEKKKPAKVEED